MSSMYVFTRKWGSPICQVLLTVQNTHRRALLFIDNRQFIGFLHKQNWTASTDINLIVTYWTLIKHQALLTIQAKLKLATSFFFTFRDSEEILACVWQEEGNFEVLKRCYIQKYPTSFLLCFWKAVNLQHMWNLEWSNVELLEKKKRNTTRSVI